MFIFAHNRRNASDFQFGESLRSALAAALLSCLLAVLVSGCATAPSSSAEGVAANASGMTAGASSESVSPEEKIRAAYSGKLAETVARCGAPVIRQESLGSFIAGISFARLVGFGADRDYLVLAYYDPSRDDSEHPGGMPSAYRLEVWDAGSDGSSMQLLMEGEASPAGQNYYCLGVSLGREGDKRYLIQTERNENRPPSAAAYGLLEDGSFGKVDGAAIDYASSVETAPVSRLNSSAESLEQQVDATLAVFDQLGAQRPVADPRGEGLASGWYFASLVPAEKAQSSLYTPIVTDVSLEGDVLKLYGSLSYNPDDGRSFGLGTCDAFGPKHWAFTLGDSVKFLAAGGTAGAKEVPREDLISVAASLNGLGLKLEIEDGQVVTVVLSS